MIITNSIELDNYRVVTEGGDPEMSLKVKVEDGKVVSKETVKKPTSKKAKKPVAKKK